MDFHRGHRGGLDGLGIGDALLLPLGECPAGRQIAVDRIMRRGLVGERVGPDALGDEFREQFRGIAEQPDRDRLSRLVRAIDDFERLGDRRRLGVEIARLEPHLDARRLAFDGDHRSAGHGRGERLRAAHAAEPRRQEPFALEIAAIMLAADFREGFVGALHDALRADIDPRAGGHLAVHHEALAIELVELLPGAPMRHEVGIGDQHARRILMRAENADRLAGLDEQRLVLPERAQRRDDLVEGFPIARRAADAAIDDEFLRPLGDARIEIVHQHAQRRFGEPGFG